MKFSLMHGAPARSELDFVARRRWPNLAGWLMLLMGVLAAASVMLEHLDLQEIAEDAERRLARQERALSVNQQRARNSGSKPVPEAEQRRVLLIRQALDAPWLSLLLRVEQAGHADIGLLSLEPASDKGALKLSGEARSLEALFDYARRLNAQPGIAGARVDSYEFKRSGAAEIVRFTLSARWEAMP